MTEKRYNQILEQCLALIEGKRLEEALNHLEDLYKIKPTRLYWYVVKALYLWAESHSPGPALEILADKGWNLFPYPGIKELTELYMKLVNSYQDIQDMQRHWLLYLGICEEYTDEEKEWLIEMNGHFIDAKSNFLEKPESEAAAECLLGQYFVFHNNVLFFLLLAYMRHRNMPLPVGREWFCDFFNSGFLSENLSPESEVAFVLFEDENSDGMDEDIICYILQQLNKTIYRIKTPIPLDVEHEVSLEDTVAVSIGTITVTGKLHTIYPASIIYNGESIGDNRDYILNYLIQNEWKNQFAAILTSGILMDTLCCQPILKKNLERLHNFATPALEKHTVFGWTGNYLAYISQIHDMDAERLLSMPPKISYSIVIPARNSAYTLRYTLMTCLDQRYKGNYEIVLSDNSTPGNTEVYQLFKELNNPKIRYYRTPREYNLSRSFEFAILHAEGEFLLTLGSDDALLPWALDALDELRKTYPDEDIIQWERGFYAWPGFNGGQQNQFIIPRNYQKREFRAEYRSRQFYFNAIFGNSNQMYSLPNLYLNSGCKRAYLKTILEKTGRLFDGICQDLYMGVVNAAINDKILNIHYPMVIAGMSNDSIGAKANRPHSLKDGEMTFLNEMKRMANVGGHCTSVYERLMPEVMTDKSSLYNSILRMIARGVTAESDLEHFNFRKWFLDVFHQMDVRDPLYDRKIHYFRYTASLHGKEFLSWFDENIYHHALIQRFVDEEKLTQIQEKKCYKEGKNPAGGQTLDASKYNVQNIYDAAKLFEKLTQL